MNRFKRLVVLDPILLLDEQWKKLRSFASEVVEFAGLNPTEILTKIYKEMEEDPKPMCWTQLAQEHVTIEELNKRIQGADAIITCWTNIPNEIILQNPHLRYIGFWTNLANHRVNYKLAKDRNIFVSMIPDYGTDSVAELTFSGILAVSRKLLLSHRNTLRGKWPYELLKTGQYVPKVNDIPQRILRDKLIGIIGLGRIGQRVAEIAQAFRMQVKYWSRKKHPKWDSIGLEFLNLEEIFRVCDIISIHLSPYAPEKIINSDLIKSLKDGAIFVNTSAGSLVDQEILFQELLTGRIFAFLDVYTGLPPRKIIKNINTLENLFTYRSGWYTQEAITYKGEYLINNIKNFLTGASPKAIWDLPINNNNEDITENQCINKVIGV